jgi:hypothetical protein
MVQLSATRCSRIIILWVSLVSFAAINFCVASKWVFIVVVVVVNYFVIDSVRKLLDTPSYTRTPDPIAFSYVSTWRTRVSNPFVFAKTHYFTLPHDWVSNSTGCNHSKKHSSYRVIQYPGRDWTFRTHKPISPEPPPWSSSGDKHASLLAFPHLKKGTYFLPTVTVI